MIPAADRFGAGWRRQLTLRRILAGLLVTALVAGLTWLAGFSQVLAVNTISVLGVKRQSVASVRAVLRDQLHRPMARVNLSGAAAAVAALPAVDSVQVVRAWPNTLEVRVVERVPVATAHTGSQFLLVDRFGVRMSTLGSAPAGLPLLTGPTLQTRSATRATVGALGQLPPGMLGQVASASANSADTVTFRLKSGALVIWGSAEESVTKAAALQALVGIKATVYDVSSPSTPVTR